METDTGSLPWKGRALSSLPNIQKTGSDKGPCFMTACCEKHYRVPQNLGHHLDPAEV